MLVEAGPGVAVVDPILKSVGLGVVVVPSSAVVSPMVGKRQDPGPGGEGGGTDEGSDVVGQHCCFFGVVCQWLTMELMFD